MSVILTVFLLVGYSNGDEASTTKSTSVDPIKDEADCCSHKSAHHRGIIYIYPSVVFSYYIALLQFASELNCAVLSRPSMFALVDCTK